MGHMNVRIYVEKMMEGLGSFTHLMKMPHAFRPHSPSTLQPSDQHIRFIREVRPGRPLRMIGGVLDIGTSDMQLYQEIQHSDGAPAAAFRTRLNHISAKTGHPFPWSIRTRAALERLRVTPSARTEPRSIEPGTPILSNKATTLTAARAANATRIGMGHVNMQHCDMFGRMRTEWFMGRISDSVPNLLANWRQTIAKAAGGKRVGAAVLEYRLIYRRWPRAGDRFEVFSALARADGKTHSLIHWLVDPDSGQAWLTSEAVAVTLDLEARKIIPSAPEHLAMLEKVAPRGLQL